MVLHDKIKVVLTCWEDNNKTPINIALHLIATKGFSKNNEQKFSSMSIQQIKSIS